MNWFRCLFKGHNWEFLHTNSYYESNWDEHPVKRVQVYQCPCCLKTKKVKL